MAEALIQFDKDHAAAYANSTPHKPDLPGPALPIIFLICTIYTVINAVFFKHVDPGFTIVMIVCAAIYFWLVWIAVRHARRMASTHRTIADQRRKQIDALNALDQQIHPNPPDRWWNTYDGLAKMNEHRRIVLWMPFDRYAETADGICLKSSCAETRPVTGAQVRALCDLPDYRTIYCRTLQPDATYRLAELCTWSIEDATKVYKSETAYYNESEVQRELSSYNSRLDKRERFDNAFTKDRWATDEELWQSKQMSSSDYLDSQYERQQRLDDYENKVRRKTYTQTDIENANAYEQWMQAIGLIVLDENDTVVAVIVYHNSKDTYLYLVNAAKVLFDISHFSSKLPLKISSLDAIRGLHLYQVDPVDVLASKPRHLSDEEWHEFLYACSGERSKKALEHAIAQQSTAAADKKRKTMFLN